MQWFKHFTESTSDPDLTEAIFLFGGDGYYVFFNTLEILSREDVFDTQLVMDFDVFRLWFPKVSKRKMIKILEYFHKKNRFSFHLTGKMISIFCDKLSYISSDYAKKLRNKSEQWPKNIPCRIRSKKKEEEEENNTNTLPLVSGENNIPENPELELKIKNVIDYLNKQTGKSFNPKSKLSVRHISARIAEKYSFADFKAVIDFKCSKWKDDPKYFEYLRPETLFGTKFESYFQAAKSEGDGSYFV